MSVILDFSAARHGCVRPDNLDLTLPEGTQAHWECPVCGQEWRGVIFPDHVYWQERERPTRKVRRWRKRQAHEHGGIA